MAKTDLHEWPLPEMTANANVPADMQQLADAMDRQVPFVCTSSTRPAPTAGLLIYETNTSRTLIGEGSGWQHVSSNWRKFTPSFRGWQALGTALQEGQYIVGPGGVITIRARLRCTGSTVMGNGKLEMFGLPFKDAGIWVQQHGTVSWLVVGPGGPLRMGICVLSNGAGSVEFLIANGSTGVSSPGPAGIPWGNTSELHVNLTYVSELGNSVI